MVRTDGWLSTSIKREENFSSTKENIIEQFGGNKDGLTSEQRNLMSTKIQLAEKILWQLEREKIALIASDVHYTCNDHSQEKEILLEKCFLR